MTTLANNGGFKYGAKLPSLNIIVCTYLILNNLLFHYFYQHYD